MGLTLNSGYGGGGSGSYPTLGVTIANGPATSVTATLGSTVVNLAYDSGAGLWHGTLKAFGTWTVEASNSGKTASDTVDVTSVAVYTANLEFSNVPDGYTELEYIESTGTQYIDTGISSTISYFEITAAWTNVSTGEGVIFGNHNGSNPFYQNIVAVNGSQKLYLLANNHFSAVDVVSDITRVYGQFYKLEGSFTSGDVNFTVDDVFIGRNTTSFSQPAMPNFLLFGFSVRGEAPRLTSAKIGNAVLNVSGTLVRNFYPARRNSDSVLGMYDTVTDTFYTNAGSGSFTAGPEV